LEPGLAIEKAQAGMAVLLCAGAMEGVVQGFVTHGFTVPYCRVLASGRMEGLLILPG
jgi:hypothetical protein